MKRFYVAASALLLGTSALAYAGTADKTVVEPANVVTDGKVVSWSETTIASWNKPVATTKADLTATKSDMAGSSKVELASLDTDLEKLAAVEVDGKLLTASADTDTGAKVETAWADTDTGAKIETASVDKVDTGMGGPLEETGNATLADLTPRPATTNYPPCSPGPGDDNCIQLYEPGVRAELASWNSPTGGLANESATTAMGGPYEPVADDSAEFAMNGDGSVDVAKGETSDAAIETASVETDTSVAGHSEYQGVGGPVEAQSGYPPCSPGPGDDRCIQLYERGVTGAGN